MHAIVTGKSTESTTTRKKGEGNSLARQYRAQRKGKKTTMTTLQKKRGERSLDRTVVAL
jgi:hypothetical protein